MTAHDSRLTPADLTRMHEAIAAYIVAARMAGGISPDSWLVASRLAAHSIGCDDRDLRDSEIDIRDQLVADMLGAVTS